MTISIDSPLMIAVSSTKTYTNHPHDTLPFRGHYTFELDLFNVLTTYRDTHAQIVNILSSCSSTFT